MTSGPEHPSLTDLARRLIDERVGYLARERSPGAAQYRSAQSSLLETVQSIGRQGDIDLILTAERSILANDLRMYGNSKGMRDSIGTALTDLSIAEKHVALVRDPGAYRVVNEAHSRSRNRKGAVPWDEARQFFQSHATRLLNMDRSRLTETEKRIIDQRKANMRTAGRLYSDLQHKALGVEAKTAKERDMGMEL